MSNLVIEYLSGRTETFTNVNDYHFEDSIIRFKTSDMAEHTINVHGIVSAALKSGTTEITCNEVSNSDEVETNYAHIKNMSTTNLADWIDFITRKCAAHKNEGCYGCPFDTHPHKCDRESIRDWLTSIYGTM